jgi:HEAT repeat protein
VTEAPPTTEGGQAESPPDRRGAPYLLLDLLVFPLVIVAVGVGVFVLFGLLTTEGKGPRDYLDLIRTGDSNRRWQAAFELSKVIQDSKDPELSDPRLVGGMVSLFGEAEGDDPRVRRFLALALGRLGNARAVPALLEYLKGVRRGEGTDSQTHIYAVWALGAIGQDAAIPELVVLTTHEDPGLRKTAVHALGVFRSEEATAALERALGDPVDDVRWNAAAALARHGHPAAVPVLEQMLDREQLARREAITPDQVQEILLQAIAAAALLSDASLAARLTQLGNDDPSLRVRAAARRTLEQQRSRRAASP